MNKHCYRILFNRSLGLLQVVPDIARRRGSSTGRVATATGARCVASMRPVAFASALALGLVSITFPARAQIVADPTAPGAQQPTVLETANGVPQVNIQTPSAAGVSRNTYQQFDVEQQGAILNNSRTNTQTQLGGWVQGNPWLAKGTARIILNEVNASDPSRLQGYLEVAGDRAQVVIANPAGITCEGCGFINTQRATLTTGTPVMRDGALEGYRVKGGAIEVQGKGLDASSTDYTDVIARSVKVNAGLWAKQLHVTTGVNEVSADQTTVTQQEAKGEKPAFALDVGALGGMYSQKIVMVGTEHGVGVRNAGTLGAQVGELVVTADGRLENSGTLQAMTDVRLEAQGGIANSGTLSAQRELLVTTSQDVDNSKGKINARRVAVNAQSLTNREGVIEQTGQQGLTLQTAHTRNREGKLGSTMTSPTPQSEQGGPLDQGGDGAGTFPPQPSYGDNSAQGGAPDHQPAAATLAKGELHITDTLNNDGGRLLAGGEMTLDTRSVDNREGVLEVAQLTVAGGDLDNRQGALRVNDATHLALSQLNNEGGKLHAAGVLTLSTDTLNNRSGLLQHAGHQQTQLAVTNSLDNSHGTLASNAEALTLDVGMLVNADGTLQHTGDAGLILRAGELQGSGGHISTPGVATLRLGKTDHRKASLEARSIDLQAESMDNKGGTIRASGNALSTLAVSHGLDNSDGGQIASQGDLKIEANELDNRRGAIEHAGNGALALNTTTLQGIQGKIASNGNLQLTGDTLTLAQGTTSAKQITIDSGTLDNTAGTLVADSGALRLTARGAMTNKDGKLLANGPVSVTANALDNQGGQLVSSEEAMTLAVTTLDNSLQGLVAAKEGISVTAATLDNSEGAIEHAGDGALTLKTDTLNGTKGKIVSNGALSIKGESVNLAQGTTSAQRIALDTGSLDNAGGTVVAHNGELQLTARNTLDNQSGKLLAAGPLTITSSELANQGGEIAATKDGALQLTVGGTLNNSQHGLLAAKGDMQVTAKTLDNSDGAIEHGGDGALTLKTDILNGPKGKIVSNGALSVKGHHTDLKESTTQARQVEIETDQLLTAGGNVIATGSEQMNIRAHDTLNNHAGRLATNGTLQLSTGELLNQLGTVLSAGTGENQLNVTRKLTNTDGSLVLAGSATVRAQALDNQGGKIHTAGHQGLALTVDGHADNSAKGSIVSTGPLRLNTGAMDNRHGAIESASTMVVGIGAGLDNREGNVIGAGDVTINAGSLDNRVSGVIASAKGSLQLDAQGYSDNGGGSLQAQDLLTVGSAGLGNSGGSIIGREVRVDTRQLALDNQHGTLASQRGELDIKSGALNNDSGLLQSTGPLNIDTHGQALTNSHSGATGGIVSGNSLTLRSGDLLNLAGVIHGNGQVVVQSGALDNQSGKLTGLANIDIKGAALDNRNGQVQAGQDLQMALAGTTNNQHGLLVAGHGLQLNADTVQNSDTQGSHASPLGLQGEHVTLTARHIDNHNGEIAADQHIAIQGGGALDNSQGRITSANTLTGTLGNVANRAGTLLSGGAFNLVANSLSGDGRVLSKGGLTLTMQQDFINEQDVSANGKAEITTAGRLTNRGTLQAKSLTVQAADIDNQASGQLRGTTTHVVASNTLANRGLIDGTQTRIQAGTLDNVGSGRIYGDQLAIQANTLQNREEGGRAAVIAARERLDIGATTLTNREHGLIFSAGDMAIGGALDANDRATGRAGLVQNDSATIESLGHLSLATGQLLNRNLHLRTEEVQVAGPTAKIYIQPEGEANKYDESELRWDGGDGGNYHVIATGQKLARYTKFYVTRSEFETQVKASDPARIRAGGNITLSGDNLTNDNSHMLAGGALLGDLQNLHNQQAAGIHRIHEEGSSEFSYTKRKRRGHKKGTFRYNDNLGAYTPADITRQIALNVAQTASYSSDGSSGYRVTGLAGTGVGDTIGGRNQPANTTPHGRQIVEVTATSGGSNGPSSVSGQQVASPGNVHGATIDEPSVTVSDKVDNLVPQAPAVIRTLLADTTVPNNSLFQPGPAASGYLVESDPRFTDYRNWLGSDYMLKQLSVDPATTQKRLGDGFYEQMLVRDQLSQLTGRRFLTGYHDDETQYRALLDAGVTVGRAWQLRPGVALSPEQMAQLTSDIVWLVERDITLADGSVTRALVPQLYVRVKPGDLDGSGTLLAANQVDLNIKGDLVNSGTIAGRTAVQLTSENVSNLGNIQGDKVALTARNNIDNIGGVIGAQTALSVKAGRDLNITSITRSDAKTAGLSDFSRTNMDRVAGLYVTGDKGTLLASAGRDLTLLAAEVSNSGKQGKTALVAGRDLTLGTVTIAEQENNIRNSENYLRSGYRTEVGSKVQGAGDVELQAGRSITARAAAVSSEQGALAASAQGDLTLQAGESSRNLSEAHKTTSRGLFSSSTKITRHDLTEQQALATTFEGQQIALQGHNVTVSGSNVLSDVQTDILAKNNLDIGTVTETRSESHFNKTSKSGLMGSGGIGFTIGKQSQSTDQQDVTQSKAGSTIGSTRGNVTLEAGNQLNVAGSDLIAGQDMSLVGKDVTIRADEQHATRHEETRSQNGGLTIALTGGAVTAAQSAYDAAKSVKETDNGRLKALKGAKAAMNGYQAWQGMQAMADAGGVPDPSFVGIAISVGNKRSQSNNQSSERNALPSEITAGGDVTVRALGDSHNTSGDLVMTGSGIKGKNVTLAAARDLVLQSAVNSSDTRGSNSSSGWNAGISFGFTQGSAGLSIFANMNAAKGKELGNSGRYTETNITAGDTLTLKSGRDATLLGAQVSGDKVKADIGRNLTLTSQQDNDHYQSKQSSVAAGGSFTFGSMTGSGYINASRQKINSDFESVVEQTGIFAGKQGFDIRVGDHTQLNGAVLAGSADESKNRLSTGTLGWSDLHNRADYKVESQSVGISGSGDSTKGFSSIAAMGSLGGSNSSGSASSTSFASISGGTIDIRDGKAQQQDLVTLHRDPTQAANGLSPIFDKQKELERMQEAQLIGEVGQQATQMVVSHHLDKANQKAKDDPEYANSKEYKALQEKWGIGSNFQRGMQAATAALQGLAGGDLTQAAAGAAAPYLAQMVKQQTDDGLSRVMAHALVQGALAAAQNKNAMVGATGAATGELVGMMATQLYHKDASQLTEGEKETVSTLATLAAGLAGGLTGDSTASALAGAQTGKTVVENNLLSNKYGVSKLSKEGKALNEKLKAEGIGNIDDLQKKFVGCNNDGDCERDARNEYRQREREAGQKLYSMYQAGKLTKDEFALLVTDYANAMLAGIQEGESNSKNFGWLGDIYMQSGRDWTPAGIILNENIAKIRSDELNSTWSSQGVSQDKIQELSLRDNIINSALTSADTNGIYNLLDNGASGEEILRFAAGAAFTKAITRNTIKQPYEPNKGAVGNMGEFFKQPGFGSQMKEHAHKTSQIFQGQSIYQAKKPVGDYIAKGDKYYLDGLHKDHIEVFDSKGRVKAVLNTDGSYNDSKTKSAIKEGRRLTK
ncbi:two-partner secretion domain-containing protein [Aeromonas veronii]